jgi:hypothetical protein
MRRLHARWRKAPTVLVHHPSVLVAVAVAALLAALASSSAPFVTTAAASEALKDRLGELTSFATGVEIESNRQLTGAESAVQLNRARVTIGAAGAKVRSRLGFLGPPVVTTQTQPSSFGPSVSIVGPAGSSGVILMARTGALAHVAWLRQVAGPGVWISDITAQAAGVRPGDVVKVEGLLSFARPSAARVRVKGVYRALAHESETDYWTNLFQEIYPQCLNCGVPPPFVFASPSQFSALVAGSHVQLEGNVELPIRGLSKKAF